jgi:hypothetical protein
MVKKFHETHKFKELLKLISIRLQKEPELQEKENNKE